MVVSKPGPAIFLLVFVCFAFTGCASSHTEVILGPYDRDQVFSAARAVLLKRHGGFQTLDASRGVLVTDYYMAHPSANSRLHVCAEIVPVPGGCKLQIQVPMERIAYDESNQKILWTEYDRGLNIEKHLVKAIRAHLENPEPEARAPQSGPR